MSDKEYYEFNTDKDELIIPVGQLQQILDLDVTVRWNHKGKKNRIPIEIIINELSTAYISNKPRVNILWQQTIPL